MKLRATVSLGIALRRYLPIIGIRDCDRQS
jgi:hypothetical protein